MSAGNDRAARTVHESCDGQSHLRLGDSKCSSTCLGSDGVASMTANDEKITEFDQ